MCSSDLVPIPASKPAASDKAHSTSSKVEHWDILREAQAFTEEQKQRLKDPKSEWHLQKVDEKNYQLYPLFVSKRYYCNLAELQPGQPGGADWIWENKYSDRPIE